MGRPGLYEARQKALTKHLGTANRIPAVRVAVVVLRIAASHVWQSWALLHGPLHAADFGAVSAQLLCCC
jgi:hypothetical protein